MRWGIFTIFISAIIIFSFILLTANYKNNNKTITPLKANVDNIKNNSTTKYKKNSNEKYVINFNNMKKSIFIPENIGEKQKNLGNFQKNIGKKQINLNKKISKWDKEGWYKEEYALVTAYCPCIKCCGINAKGITSIGKNAWRKGVAADPIKLEYGTKVEIPGYGISVIDDTGGAMRKSWRKNGILHLDVRMTYHHEARKWGKKYLYVKIYED